jgi:cell division inhibitor SulA
MNYSQSSVTEKTFSVSVNPRNSFIASPPVKSQRSADTIASQLALASRQNKWILFTGQCPKPDLNWLSQRNVDCSKVVYLKNSEHNEQIKVVMDGILSGNASAIVATSAIDSISQQQLTQLAKDNHCALHFVDVSNAQQLH